jgi:hypothetical protein
MIFWYHSLTCVCRYCLALDCDLDQGQVEIGYMITTSKDGS